MYRGDLQHKLVHSHKLQQTSHFTADCTLCTPRGGASLGEPSAALFGRGGKALGGCLLSLKLGDILVQHLARVVVNVQVVDNLPAARFAHARETEHEPFRDTVAAPKQQWRVSA